MSIKTIGQKWEVYDYETIKTKMPVKGEKVCIENTPDYGSYIIDLIGDGENNVEALYLEWKSVFECGVIVDEEPIKNSINAVKSGGVFNWFGGLLSTLKTTAKNIIGAINELFETTVKTSGNQTVGGIKTFTDPLLLNNNNARIMQSGSGLVLMYDGADMMLNNEALRLIHVAGTNIAIKGVANPVDPKDAANKEYVDQKVDETGIQPIHVQTTTYPVSGGPAVIGSATVSNGAFGNKPISEFNVNDILIVIFALNGVNTWCTAKITSILGNNISFTMIGLFQGLPGIPLSTTPHLWPSDGSEVDLGDGSFGRRFAGSGTSPTIEIYGGNYTTIIKILSAGGNWTLYNELTGSTDMYLFTNGSSGSRAPWSQVSAVLDLTNRWTLYLILYTNSLMMQVDVNYDIWVRYTK